MVSEVTLYRTKMTRYGSVCNISRSLPAPSSIPLKKKKNPKGFWVSQTCFHWKMAMPSRPLKRQNKAFELQMKFVVCGALERGSTCGPRQSLAVLWLPLTGGEQPLTAQKNTFVPAWSGPVPQPWPSIKKSLLNNQELQVKKGRWEVWRIIQMGDLHTGGLSLISNTAWSNGHHQAWLLPTLNTETGIICLCVEYIWPKKQKEKGRDVCSL